MDRAFKTFLWTDTGKKYKDNMILRLEQYFTQNNAIVSLKFTLNFSNLLDLDQKLAILQIDTFGLV